MKLLAYLLPVLAAVAFPAHAQQAPGAALREVESHVLNGRITQAISALRTLSPNELPASDQQQRQCLLERFDSEQPVTVPIEGASAIVADIARLYQEYWWHALREPSRRDQLELQLKEDLEALVAGKVTSAGFDAVESGVQARLEKEGWKVQLGRTPPLRDLMLWKRTDPRSFTVDLPGGPQTVLAYLLDDFALLGWSAYGRCGRGSNGGWATDAALYAVMPAYKGGVDSEEFRVVFLAHEAQHFADKNRYVGMADWELEYRAKLVEIAMGNQTSVKRLAKFQQVQGDDPGAPHPYANRQVIQHLQQRLGPDLTTQPLAPLRSAALQLLEEDTARRHQAIGAKR